MKVKVAIALVVVYTLLIYITLYHLGLQPVVFWSKDSKPLKIYMYEIAPKFNTDLMKTYGNYKAPNLLIETGLGPPLNYSEFIFDTNQFALDIYFHYRLMHSKYLTNDISEADLFYFPWYANLAKESGHYDAIWHFWEFIENHYNITFITQNIRKHFMVYGGCEMFSGPFKDRKLVSEMSVIMLERNENKTSFGGAPDSRFIVAPYPAQVHFQQGRKDTIDYSKKTLLVSSVWNSRYPFRWGLANSCQKSPEICQHVELLPNNDKYNRTRVYELTASSIFCLSPPGDSPTRKAFYDALLLGCINVIYENWIKYPFDDLFDYDSMTVYIPKEKSSDTLTILQQIPKEQIQQKQQYIEKHRIHFQYTAMHFDEATDLPFDRKDAFNLLLDEVYKQSLD